MCLCLSATPPNEPCEASSEASPVVKRKKRYRIWTSPRSKRIRCRVESRPERGTLFPVSASALTQQPRPQKSLFKPQDASVYNFPVSSQDSASSSPSRAATSSKKKGKRTTKNERVRRAVERAQMAVTRKQKRKLQLQVINQQWGVGADGDTGDAGETLKDRDGGGGRGGEGGSSERDGMRPRKRVSFQTPNSPLAEDHRKENAPPSERLAASPQPAAPDAGVLSAPSATPLEATNKDTASPAKRSPCRMPKRARQADGDVDQQSTPKRTRASPSGGRRHPAAATAIDGLSALSTPPPSPQALLPSPRQSPGGAGRELGLSSTPSPAGKRRSHGRQSQGSPAFAKKNHKGETPLHLAAIKVRSRPARFRSCLTCSG